VPFLRSFWASRIWVSESELLPELEVKVFNTSSQQSSMAATHSSKSGGHCATGSALCMDGPEVKMDSRALRLALDRRDMVNGRHLN